MAERTWTDMIGREHANGSGFVSICPDCGALMHTHNLGGERQFNESGWGVWSTPHTNDCSLQRASDAEWTAVLDREVYFYIVSLTDHFRWAEPLREVVERFLKKKTTFAELRDAIDS